jgi:hypothetical protein
MTMSLQATSGIGLDSTATINSVDVTKSFISASCNSAGGAAQWLTNGMAANSPTAGVKLTSATSLLASLGNLPNLGSSPQSLSTGILYFEVIEYV